MHKRADIFVHPPLDSDFCSNLDAFDKIVVLIGILDECKPRDSCHSDCEFHSHRSDQVCSSRSDGEMLKR